MTSDLCIATARLTELRRRYSVLRAPVFLYGQDSPGAGVNDIEWWDERGERLSDGDWNNPEGRALVMRRAVKLDNGDVEAVSLLLNGSDDAITFKLPPPEHAKRTVLVDSTDPQVMDAAFEEDYQLGAHGAALVAWTIAAADLESDPA